MDSRVRGKDEKAFGAPVPDAFANRPKHGLHGGFNRCMRPRAALGR